MEMLREIYQGENIELGEGNIIQNPLILLILYDFLLDTLYMMHCSD